MNEIHIIHQRIININIKATKYTFTISEEFLSENEKNIFNDFLHHNKLDQSIWPIFESLFKSGVKGTIPLVIRVFDQSSLCGCAIILICSKYGRSLFNNKFLSSIMDSIGIPFYLWIKFGCCMDMMSNLGFVKNVDLTDEICKEIATHLKNKSFLTIINDYSLNKFLYPKSAGLPALPHALIKTSDFKQIKDFLKHHKNLKRKANSFKNKGGTFEIVNQNLSPEELEGLKKCFISTSEKSIFYLPYQDLYLNSAITTSKTKLNNVFYFIARINGDFIGYQAAVKSGKNLNALHGAFDRTRKSNFHAYDLLFLNMTEFAIKHNLELIDFGAIVNITKQRMVNEKKEMSYFLYSKFKTIQFLFALFLRITKVQSKVQLKFR